MISKEGQEMICQLRKILSLCRSYGVQDEVEHMMVKHLQERDYVVSKKFKF